MKRSPSKTDAPDPGPTRLFAYLDGELGSAAKAAFEAEVAADPALAAELRAFRTLFGAMRKMEAPTPPFDLEVSVLASLRARPSPLRRVWDWLAGSPDGATTGAFDTMLDGRLTTRQAAALSALAARDVRAARVLSRWRRLGRELSRLPEFAPADGFADRVMARVRVPEAATRLRTPARARLRALWPRRRERLAAASGIAFGPTAAVVGVAYLLFTNNPLVTLANLGSFLRGKGREAFLGASQSLIDAGVDLPATLGDGGLAGGIAGPAVLTGLVLMAALTLVSGWILYRNIVNTTLVDPTGSERRHAPL